MRTDNPLELSPAHAGVEAGARPGNRVHRRHEARRADPADRAVRGTAHQRGLFQQDIFNSVNEFYKFNRFKINKKIFSFNKKIYKF